jgi:hypothetical protein
VPSKAEVRVSAAAEDADNPWKTASSGPDHTTTVVRFLMQLSVVGKLATNPIMADVDGMVDAFVTGLRDTSGGNVELLLGCR